MAKKSTEEETSGKRWLPLRALCGWLWKTTINSDHNDWPYGIRSAILVQPSNRS